MSFADYAHRCDERRRQLAELMRKHAGRVSDVARDAGLERKYTYRVLHQFGLIEPVRRGNAQWRALQ